MTTSRHCRFALALAATLASGCSTSPPGAGFTNGDKATFTADEKPAVRDDLPRPTPDSGDAKLAGSAADIPGPGNPPPSPPDSSKNPSDTPASAPAPPK